MAAYIKTRIFFFASERHPILTQSPIALRFRLVAIAKHLKYRKFPKMIRKILKVLISSPLAWIRLQINPMKTNPHGPSSLYNALVGFKAI